MKVNSVKRIAADIFQVGLVSNEHVDFEFQGYSSLYQLGRCFALNFDSKITRLYTTEGFLSKNNI